MSCERYAVVDVETTGFSPARDRIVEVACALIDGDRIAGRWSTLVNPGIAIPERATAVHGITDEMVEAAPGLADALNHLRRLCEGRIVAAHCARFDLSFLGPSIATEGLCTMRLAQTLIPEAPNHKNQTLRWFLEIDRKAGEAFEAHRALGDAVVSAHVLIVCRRRFRARRPGVSWDRFVRSRAFVDMAPAPSRLAS
jgi:DNA polymerase III epsilon subunit-like protein